MIKITLLMLGMGALGLLVMVMGNWARKREERDTVRRRLHEEVRRG